MTHQSIENLLYSDERTREILESMVYKRKTYIRSVYPRMIEDNDVHHIYDKFLLNLLRHRVSPSFRERKFSKLGDICCHWPFPSIYDRYKMRLMKSSYLFLISPETDMIVSCIWHMTVISYIAFGIPSKLWRLIDATYDEIWSLLLSRTLSFVFSIETPLDDGIVCHGIRPHAVTNGSIIEVGDINNITSTTMKLLVYTAIYRSHNIGISKIVVFDPMSGVYVMDVSTIDLQYILSLI